MRSRLSNSRSHFPFCETGGLPLSAGNGLPVLMSEAESIWNEEGMDMGHVMEGLLKNDDAVVMERDFYDNLLQTIDRQNKEIRTLEYRIKTLFSATK